MEVLCRGVGVLVGAGEGAASIRDVSISTFQEQSADIHYGFFVSHTQLRVGISSRAIGKPVVGRSNEQMHGLGDR
jgi:hypothetical protein